VLRNLRWATLARLVSRGLAGVRLRLLPARRIAVGVQVDEDMEFPPDDVLEAIHNAVAHLPEVERHGARLDLLNILAKNYDEARLPYPRWLSCTLDQIRRGKGI
jgi:hypothetical protein